MPQQFDFSDAGIPVARQQGFNAGFRAGEERGNPCGSPQIITTSREGPPGGFNVCIINPFPGDRREDDGESLPCEDRCCSKAFISNTTDVSNSVMLTVPQDGLYRLRVGLVTKLAGPYTVTATMQFVTPTGTESIEAVLNLAIDNEVVITGCCGMGSQEVFFPELFCLLGGSPISIQTQGGPYTNGGAFDAFFVACREA